MKFQSAAANSSPLAAPLSRMDYDMSDEDFVDVSERGVDGADGGDGAGDGEEEFICLGYL